MMALILALVVLLLLVSVGLMVTWRYARARRKVVRELNSGSQLIQTPVGPIEYRLSGGTGPVILYLHGTPGGYNQAPKPRQGFRQLTLSRPGYLRTPLSVGQTPEEQAIACSALMNELGLKRLWVLGASGGGPAALAFAGLFPERTQGLIMVEAISEAITLPEIKMPMRFDFTYWLLMSLLGKAGAEGIARRFIPDAKNLERLLAQPAQLARYADVFWSIWPVSTRQAGWRNDRAQFKTLQPDYRAVSCPTLIVHGTADTAVPVEQSQRLAQRIPGASLHLVDGADHAMPYTHHDELNAAIGAFMAAN